MTSFIGDFSCKVDAKGRLSMPAAFKKQLGPGVGSSFVVKKDLFENCLAIYAMDQWQREMKIIRKRVSPNTRDGSEFLKNFHRNTAEVELDSAGRLLIPRKLLEKVGAGKEVVLVGQDIRLQLWAAGQYESDNLGEDEMAGLAEKFLGDMNYETGDE
jgi:MraZ protein